MKPKELMIAVESRNGYANHIKTLNYYWNDDCVLGYYKCELGVAILIRGKIKPFGFVQYKDKFCMFQKSFGRMDETDVMKMIQKSGVIVDSEGMQNAYYKLLGAKI